MAQLITRRDVPDAETGTLHSSSKSGAKRAHTRSLGIQELHPRAFETAFLANLMIASRDFPNVATSESFQEQNRR